MNHEAVAVEASQDGRGRYAVTRAVFLRCLGVVWLAAFVSYWVQLDGLVGSHGILPAADFLDFLRDRGIDNAWTRLPTLCWVDASDTFLHVLCGSGVLAACVLVVGIAPLVCLAVAFVCYLSLVKIGGDFYLFQWDSLLLETGFASLFLAPLTLRPRLVAAGDPPRIGLWLVRWVIFRLMFESGVVKLTWGDPSWRFDDLTALTYHYWTQPLPPWTAWYADRVPVWVHQASGAAMYVAELVVPFTMFAPRRMRHLGALALIGLQVGLLVTGNYGFFNLLTIVLCIPLLDDSVWPRRWRGGDAPQTAPRRSWTAWVGAPFAVLVLLVTSSQLCGSFQTLPQWRETVAPVERAVAPFEIVNGYGLFRVMTKERLEIVVEGSADGTTWVPYEFKWKPGEVHRRPGFTTPHMPRLDWQMWFQSLDWREESPWFTAFLDRLLEGRPEVLALLETNPFPDTPPRLVRAVLYDYRFADPDTHASTGAWWRRRRLTTMVEPRGR